MHVFLKCLKRLFLPGMCLMLFSGTVLRAEEINVAVAANFTPAMRELAAVFEKESGDRVIISSGSSGRLYAQILNGAPFHLFFSADQDKPAILVRNGLAEVDSLFTYAVGTLVLWSKDTNMKVANAEALRDPGNSQNYKIAIANPRLAPYGVAANQVLSNLEKQGAFIPMVVMGENITQAYQFVDTGNAAMGLVALSQVTVAGEIMQGTGWIVPQELYDPIRQDAVLLSRAKENSVARSFLKFLQGELAKTILNSYGYGTD